MANSKEECCIVCLSNVPKSTMRRRLYSEAAKHVVQVLHELSLAWPYPSRSRNPAARRVWPRETKHSVAKGFVATCGETYKEVFTANKFSDCFQLFGLQMTVA